MEISANGSPSMELGFGVRVQVDRLVSTTGLHVEAELIKNRSSQVTGTVKDWVSGFGGNTWCVQHDDGKLAVYWSQELLPENSQVMQFQRNRRRRTTHKES